MKSFFVIDVESVGLHGEAFAVAGGVYLPNGSARLEFCYACPIDECVGSDEDRQWVKDHCPTFKYNYQKPKAVREAFWAVWQKANDEGAIMAADCLWPVEARFVAKCVDDDPARKWEGPYPFLEISSVLIAAGMDPLAKYPRTPKEQPEHDPLSDARHSARLLLEALEKIKNKSLT